MFVVCSFRYNQKSPLLLRVNRKIEFPESVFFPLYILVVELNKSNKEKR